MISLCFPQVLARRALAFVVVFLGCITFAWGERLSYPGPDRKFLPVFELVGEENPESISQLAGGAIQVDYRNRNEFLDGDGSFLFKKDRDSKIVYSPIADQVIDFNTPGIVEVRDRESGAELARYPFAPNESELWDAFSVADGRVCTASFSSVGTVGFDPLTGEILWSDEKKTWSYASVGEGSVVVRYTHMVWIPEDEYKFFGPVSETLHHALTGDSVLPEDTMNGFLVPEVSLSGQAVYVGKDVWLVDTENAEYEKLDLGGRQVKERLACQSISGDAVAALTFEENDGVRENFQFSVWKKGESASESIDWNDEWGDIEGVASLSISDDASSLVFALANGSVHLLNTSSRVSSVLVEGRAIDPGPWVGTEPSIALVPRILPGGKNVLVSGLGYTTSILDLDTAEIVYPESVDHRTSIHGFMIVSPDSALAIGGYPTLRKLDLATFESAPFGEERIPQVVDVWPIDPDGMATVFFADGTWQTYDTGTGKLMGSRDSVLPLGVSVLHSDADSGLVVGSDYRVYNVDTGEVLFDLEGLLEKDGLYSWTKKMFRELLADPYLRVHLLESGTQIAFFVPAADFRYDYALGEPSSFESGKVVIFGLNDGSLIAERDYDWASVVESEDFIVGVERMTGRARGSDFRVGVFDAERNLAEIYGVAADSSVSVAPDGRHFAVLSSDGEPLEGESQYELTVRLREFALEKNGFHELDSTVWKGSFKSGEFDLGVSRILDYKGPGEPVLALALRDQLLELRSNGIVEWKEEGSVAWYGTRAIDRTAKDELLLLDQYGRLGLYATFVPRTVGVEVAVDEFGYTVLDLSSFDLDRIDVWYSEDLKNWNRWDWVPLKVVPDKPVFYRVVEWVEEN